MFRYLSHIITFSSRNTLSKVQTREAKTCNYVKTFQKRGMSCSSGYPAGIPAGIPVGYFQRSF